jgi:hypothetical protein
MESLDVAENYVDIGAIPIIRSMQAGRDKRLIGRMELQGDCGLDARYLGYYEPPVLFEQLREVLKLMTIVLTSSDVIWLS